MRKIMFICTGNTCRSAMAEEIFRKKVKDKGLSLKYSSFSAGIYAYDGERSTYEACKLLEDRYGIDLSNHRSTGVRNSNIEEMDLVLCMTDAHKKILSMIYPNLTDRIYALKEYVNLFGDIEDPYGGNIEVYSECADVLDKCLDLLIKKEEAI